MNYPAVTDAMPDKVQYDAIDDPGPGREPEPYCAANGLARRLVVASHRCGGQAQFIAPPPDPRVTDRLGSALDWARAHLDEPLTVQDLARESRLSARQPDGLPHAFRG